MSQIHRLLIGAGAAALAWPSIVAAQATGEQAPVPQSVPEANAPQGAAPGTVTPTDEDGGLIDIVVTAQRIAQSAQKTPIAISVVDPSALQQQSVTRPEDLSRVVPALVANSAGGSYTTFSVRGVGNATLNSYSDPAVAFNYDGVYIARPSSTSGAFYDLQRVEVLKGPQGTLYGRNATGGAINLIPNRPELGRFSIEGVASYGNRDTVTAQGAVNVALGENAALRVSGSYAAHDPYYDDGTGDQSEYGGRVQLYTELTPELNVRLAVDFAHQGDGKSFTTYLGQSVPTFGPTGFAGYQYVPSGFGPGDGVLSPAGRAYLASKYIVQAGRTGQVQTGVPYNDNNFWGATAEINWKLGSGTLTIQPAWRESELDNSIATGLNAAPTKERDEQASLEARYAGTIGPVDYIVGGLYFRENIKTKANFSQYVLVPFQDIATSTDSYAGFGKLTFNVTDRLRLTAAGRYTKDSKRFNGVSDVYILFCGNPALGNSCPTLPFIPTVNSAAELRAFYAAQGVPVTPVPLFALPPFVPGSSQTAPFVLQATTAINADLNNDRFTYRLAGEYDVAPGSLLYASYETGYHSGGFAFAKGLETYRPETIQAWTVGSKNRFLNNRVQLNVEAFYWRYRDQQFTQFGYDLGTPPTSVFLTRNIGRSTIKGVDADAQIKLTSTTLIGGSVQYVDTRYDSFVYQVPNQGLPPVTTCGVTPTTSAINGTVVAVYQVDCSGKPAINTPKWSFNVNGEQTVPLGDYKIVLQAGTRYRGRAIQDPNYSDFVFAKAGFNTNASVTFGPADDRWFVSGFINNIENYRRLFAVTQVPASGVYVGSYEAPRIYGIRAGFRFQ